MSGLLETLGLKRKQPPAPVPPPDPKAQVIMIKAAGASAKARTAGVTLNGRRDALRKEIEDLAIAKQYQQAEAKLTEFERHVDGGVAWAGRAKELANTRTQAEQLQQTGDRKAEGMLKALAQVEVEANALRFDNAGKLLDGTKAAVEKRVPEWRQVRLHNNEMAKLKPRLDNATGPGGIPGRGDGGHALQNEWQAFEAALADCPANVTDTIAVDAYKLVFHREALTKALDALANAYGKKTFLPGDAADEQWGWSEREYKARRTQLSSLLQKAKYVKPLTAELEEAVAEFAAMDTGGATWVEMLTKLDAKAAKAQQLLRMAERAQPLPDEQKFFAAYGKISEWVKTAAANDDTDDQTKNAKTEFNNQWGAFREILDSWDDDRFTRCLEKLPALKVAADAVMKARRDAALRTVDALNAPSASSPSGGPPVPASNAEKNARAVKAAIGDPPPAGAIPPAVLKSLPADKKIAILDALKVGGTLVPFNDNASDSAQQAARDNPRRKAQRAVYAAMDLDERFVEAEEIDRRKVLDALLQDKEELKKARDEWPLLGQDDRKKVLEKLLKAHCDGMGFKAPANGIKFEDQDASTNGDYLPGGDVIRINPKSRIYDDFELQVDLLFHENSHNWQGQLVNRLDPSHPNPLTPAEDPPYTQALMFQSNNAGAEIIPPAEDYASYQKQPWEDHSWSTGPKTARMLMKGLAT